MRMNGTLCVSSMKARILAPTPTLSEGGELAGSFRLQALYGPLAGHDLSSYGILWTYTTYPAVPRI